jgi:hypothetical protein
MLDDHLIGQTLVRIITPYGPILIRDEQARRVPGAVAGMRGDEPFSLSFSMMQPKDLAEFSIVDPTGTAYNLAALIDCFREGKTET